MRRGVVAVALLLVPLMARADAPGVYAITNGVVHPVAGPQIGRGTVVIRDGLIESVGAGVAVPPDATVVDVGGAHVYPGFIDAYTTLGFTAPRRTGVSVSDQRRDDAAINAASMAAERVSLSDEEVDAKRATGVTTIVAAPTAAIFNGQSVVLNLGPGGTPSRVIRNRAAMHVAFNTRRASTYPGSLMGVISYIRQTLFDAQQHSVAMAVYERSPSGLRRPESDAALEALVPLIRREMPAVFAADGELAMRRAMAIAREFNLRLVLAGARQAYRMPADLRDVPVLVSVKWPVAPSSAEDRAEQPLRVIRDRALSPTTPSVLARAGVRFALVSAPGKTADLIPGIRKAMENGLTADDALRAVTLTPAAIFGVDRQLGSIERGKIANLVISNGPVFSEGSKITRLFVDGREVRLPAEEKKETADAAASPIDGSWALSVSTPQGSVAITVSLRLENEQVTGSFSGDRGSGQIRPGTFDGTTLEFSISAQVEAEPGEWLFRGTVREGGIEGTVTTSAGTFQFTGRKSS